MLRGAGPWGQGFPEPQFDGDFRVLDARLVGERHLKLQLGPALPGLRSAAGGSLEAIAFGYVGGDSENAAIRGGACVRVLYRLEVNEYRGAERVQLNCQHLDHRQTLVLSGTQGRCARRHSAQPLGLNTRSRLAGFRRRAAAGLIGLRTSSPPQLGQTRDRACAPTHSSEQYVHSKLQIHGASREFRRQIERSQHSQLGLRGSTSARTSRDGGTRAVAVRARIVSSACARIRAWKSIKSNDPSKISRSAPTL